MSDESKQENETQNQVELATNGKDDPYPSSVDTKEDNIEQDGGRKRGPASTFGVLRAALNLLKKSNKGASSYSSSNTSNNSSSNSSSSSTGGKPPTSRGLVSSRSTPSLTKLVGCVRPSPEEDEPRGEGMTSRYSSALSLSDLDHHQDNAVASIGTRPRLGSAGSSGEVFYDGVEDEMIDEKADLFIAKFYKQMELDHR